MPKARRKAMTGRGAVGKSIVAGAKDQATNRVSATVIDSTDTPIVQGIIIDRTADGATVHTDERGSYQGMPFDHETVGHGVGEYVRGQTHINGIESFWALLKRGYTGIFHKISPKHLDRYVREFAARHNVREVDTADRMASVVAGLVGKQLIYGDVIADNGLSSGARS